MNRILFVPVLLALAGCAGTEGQPESVRALLVEKYIGKQLEVVVGDLGTPNETFEFKSGAKSITWQRVSDKYKTNAFIKSDERCVITMITDVTGSKIASVGIVDDSLGAFQFSYCKEQYSLKN